MAADQLARLEDMGLMTAKDNYQALLIMIADDIRQQHRYRQARRKELGKLKNTKAALEQKSAFLRERMRDYQKYLQTVQESTANGAIKVKRGIGRLFSGKEESKEMFYGTALFHNSPLFPCIWQSPRKGLFGAKRSPAKGARTQKIAALKYNGTSVWCGFCHERKPLLRGLTPFPLPIVVSTAGKLADKGVLVSLYAGSGSRIEGKT